MNIAKYLPDIPNISQPFPTICHIFPHRPNVARYLAMFSNYFIVLYNISKYFPYFHVFQLANIFRCKYICKHICEQIGGYSDVLIVGAILGQMKLTKPQAENAAELFGLSKTEKAMLNETPMRGMPMPPTDPLIYRFYELVMVNGPAWKALIEEEYGDGIMSAIDFSMDVEREPSPKGDRVRLTMSGKYLAYSNW